jgi:hypothetical protein
LLIAPWVDGAGSEQHEGDEQRHWPVGHGSPVGFMRASEGQRWRLLVKWKLAEAVPEARDRAGEIRELRKQASRKSEGALDRSGATGGIFEGAGGRLQVRRLRRACGSALRARFHAAFQQHLEAVCSERGLHDPTGIAIVAAPRWSPTSACRVLHPDYRRCLPRIRRRMPDADASPSWCGRRSLRPNASGAGHPPCID